MTRYCAIVQRGGRWECLSTGQDPHEVYQQAVALLQGPEGDERELPVMWPESEQALDTLRVVPLDIAQTTYHAVYPVPRD